MLCHMRFLYGISPHDFCLADIDVRMHRELPSFISPRGGVALRLGDGVIHSWLNRLLLPDTVGTGGDSHSRFPIGISFPAGSGLVAFAAATVRRRLMSNGNFALPRMRHPRPRFHPRAVRLRPRLSGRLFPVRGSASALRVIPAWSRLPRISPTTYHPLSTLVSGNSA